MASAFGFGSILGLAAAAALPKPSPGLFSAFALGTIAIGGVLTALLGAVYSTLPALGIALGIGITLGYSNLLMITWVQRRVPGSLMGRVMSLMMLGSLGLVPVSMLVAGLFVQTNLSALFAFGGMGMAVLAVGSLASRNIRNMGREPVVDEGQQSAAPSTVPSAV